MCEWGEVWPWSLYAYTKTRLCNHLVHIFLCAPTADSFHWQAICDKFPDDFELPSGLPLKRDIEHKNNLRQNHQFGNIVNIDKVNRN